MLITMPATYVPEAVHKIGDKVINQGQLALLTKAELLSLESLKIQVYWFFLVNWLMNLSCTLVRLSWNLMQEI